MDVASLGVGPTLQRFRDRLLERFGPRLRELRLFGSWARGEAHEESDADVLVGIDALTDAERREVLAIAYEVDLENDWLVGLSPLVYASEQLSRLRAGGRRLLTDIDREGLPV